MSLRALFVKHRSVTAFAAGVLTASVIAGGGIAIASTPSSATEAITACVSNTSGSVRIIDYQGGKRCTSSESTLNWSKGYPYRGGWSSTTSYGVLDAVTSQGSSYLAKQPSLNVVPPNATYWGLLAAAGDANLRSTVVTLKSADFGWNSQYTYTTASGGDTAYFTRYHDIAVPALTQPILNSGSVQVFFTSNANNANQWSPLPFSFLSGTGAYYDNFVFETSVGNVRVHYFYTANGAGTVPSDLSTHTIPKFKFKVVVTAAG